MVQVIAALGEGVETSKLLREHSIWKLVENDACVSLRRCRMLIKSFMSKNFY